MHNSITTCIGLFLQPTLMHNSITTCMSDYHPRHVSGLDMPILRRNNCTNTASGILSLLSSCTLHRLRGWVCQGPKHVEDGSVTYMLLLNCALKLVEEIIQYNVSSLNVLKYTQFKTEFNSELSSLTISKLKKYVADLTVSVSKHPVFWSKEKVLIQ